MSGPIYCRVWIFAALIATLAGSFVFFFATSPASADPLNAPADPLRSRAQGVSSSVAPPDASSPVRSAPSVSSPLPRWEPQQLQSPERSASTSAGCLPAPLKQALADVQSRFGAVEVVSTHRPGARISGTGHRSLHASCQAVDFRPARGTYGAVASYLCERTGRAAWHVLVRPHPHRHRRELSMASRRRPRECALSGAPVKLLAHDLCQMDCHGRVPSTPSLYACEGVDARDKGGHDDVVFTVHAIPL